MPDKKLVLAAFPMQLFGATAAILVKILQVYSFLTCHSLVMFPPNRSKFPRRYTQKPLSDSLQYRLEAYRFSPTKIFRTIKMFILIIVKYTLKLPETEELTIIVLLFPPSAFFSSLVNMEFLYGTTMPNRNQLQTKNQKVLKRVQTSAESCHVLFLAVL